MQTITASEIAQWDRFYRSNFINSLTGFKPAGLIGTINSMGQTNLGVFSSIVHIGSQPPFIGYINRPRKASPHTLSNIEETGMYTINHIYPSILEKAHQTSAKYPKNVSEFEVVGFEPEFVEGIIAPFVKESLVKYALTLEEIIPIRLNDTSLVIGKVQYVQFPDNILLDDGFLELDKSNTVCSNGRDRYYTANFVHRYPYAKPGVTNELTQ